MIIFRFLRAIAGMARLRNTPAQTGRAPVWGLTWVFLLLVAGSAPGLHAAGGEKSPITPIFVDVTAASGIAFRHISGDDEVKNYLFEAKGGGVAALDFDNDGWLDLYFPQGSTMKRWRENRNLHGALYRNLGDWTFEDVTERAGLTRPGWGVGAAAADIDNDGFVDLFVTNLGANHLYRNNGDGSFTEASRDSGLEVSGGWSTSAGFADADNDGRLDLFVAYYLAMGPDNLPKKDRRCQYLGHRIVCGPNGFEGAPDEFFLQNKDGRFRKAEESTGIADPERRFGLGCVWGDVDSDGDIDLYVANDTHSNSLFVNRGDGVFREKGLVSGLSLNEDGRAQAGMGVDMADYDNDGLLDAYSTHWVSDYSTLYRNEGDLLFEDVTSRAGIATPEYLLVSWGVGFVDLNNDGWKDIFHANGHIYPVTRGGVPLKHKGFQKRARSGPERFRDRGSETYLQFHSLYLNRANGTFKDAGREAGPGLQVRSCGRGAAFADFDNDGDIDVVVANMNGTPLLLRNDLDAPHHWISFRAVGRKSNRDGIGARITVTAGGVSQVVEVKRSFSIYSSSDPRAHFGLGEASAVDRIEVRWPSGTIQTFQRVAADRHYIIDETKGLEKAASPGPSKR